MSDKELEEFNYQYNNIMGEFITRVFGGGGMLDRKNLRWKLIGDEWIAKRGVLTFDKRACWVEDTTKENIKFWLCGEDADYNEIFYK